MAWGENTGRQIDVPVGLSGVVAVAAGGFHSLALKSDGTVVGWGRNYTQFAPPYFIGPQSTAPVGVSGVIAIAAGHDHSLALKRDGTVVAWGANQWGQAVVPEGLSGVIALAAGGWHSLAIRDTTPPTIAVPASIAATASTNSGAIVTFIVTAEDAVSGSSTPTCVPSSGSTFSPGITHVTCTATDWAGNTGRSSFDVTVTFDWSGVLSPLNVDGTSIFKLGRTVPLKFILLGESSGITNLPTRLVVSKISDGVVGSDEETTSTSAADFGNTFRYDAAGQYIYNLATTTLTAGTYRARIEMADGVERVVQFSLRP